MRQIFDILKHNTARIEIRLCHNPITLHLRTTHNKKSSPSNISGGTTLYYYSIWRTTDELERHTHREIHNA